MSNFSAPFRKMNGLGNEFAIFDLRDSDLKITTEDARQIADKATGPGCDQVISIENRNGAPYMGIWNADGSEASACGNAARCVAWILMNETGESDLNLQSPSNLLKAQRIGEMRVAINMGEPKFHWRDIPLAEQMDDTRFIDVKLGPIDNPVLWGPSAVNVGNPHCVFFVKDVNDHAIDRFGPLIEHHPLFPEGVNVSIAAVESTHRIRLRVWERGVGVTRACGTAACAAAISAHRRRLSARKASVVLDGGELAIEWREEDNAVIMSGPVEFEYDGEYTSK